MSELPAADGELQQSMARARMPIVIEGVMLVVLGAVAIVLPGLAAIALTILLGWIFVFSGAIGLIVTLNAPHMPGFKWSLVSASVALAAGVLLTIWPIRDVDSMMWVLGAFFAVDGIFSVLYAVDHRRQMTGRWEWMLASGIVTLALAGLILARLPLSVEMLGILVGIDLVIAGTALVAIGTGLKAQA
jgi:uncharacterized membrane protein HdeD (DUF308 family)